MQSDEWNPWVERVEMADVYARLGTRRAEAVERLLEEVIPYEEQTGD